MTLRSLLGLLALSPFVFGQTVPVEDRLSSPSPPYPPPGHVLVGDMWVPRHVVFEDGHWDGPAWTNGIVPYVFHSSVSPWDQDVMLLAMAEIEAVCGVDFVPWTNTPQYVQIREVPGSYSNSSVGMQPIGQVLNIGEGHWDDPFVIVHELLHALGVKHEHQRPDRNLYVTINWGNVHQSACNNNACNGNFQLFNGQALGPYDFASVMHYPDHAQSVGSTNTITCKPGYTQFQNVMGQRSYLSYYDVQGLQTKYGIPAGPDIGGYLPSTVVEGVGTVDLIFYGSGFFTGSTQEGAGTQGSRVQYLHGGVWQDAPGSVVETGGRMKAQLQVDGSLGTGVVPLRILNDSLAGGASNVVLFTVTPLPCVSADERLGEAIAGLPDIDGDGRDEVVISRPGYQNGRGQVLCLAGADGGELWARQGLWIDGNYGQTLAVLGDVDGDLVADVAVGEPGANDGRVHVLSGSTGLSLLQIDGAAIGAGPGFGEAIALAGDLNLDNVPDLVVGSPDWDNGRGRIDLLSGASGGLFFAIHGLQSGERFGSAVGGGFDCNGDGRPEVVAGAPRFDGGNGAECGRMSIYQGAFGTSLVGATGEGPGDQFGTSVVIAPSSDGSADGNIVVGAPEPGINPSTIGPGYVRSYRYATGPLTGLIEQATWRAYIDGARYGDRIQPAGDVDDDGGTDYLIAAPGFPAIESKVELVSGRTGQVLWRTHRPPASDGFGKAIGVADRSAVGRLDALIGRPFADGSCIDSGAWSSNEMRVRPAFERVMITEINTAVPGSLPAAVELTNFAPHPVDLSGWQVRVRDVFPLGAGGSGSSSSLSGIVLEPLESIVLRTAIGQSFVETPPSVQTLSVLSGGPSVAADFVCGLFAANGYVVDEVRCESGSGSFFEFSFGGKFGAPVQNHQSGPIQSASRFERIWGLDSNRSTDWTVGGTRSMGLESGSSGRRSWPRTESYRPPVVLNEVARGGADYVELRNRGTESINLQGWALRFSTPHGGAIAEVLPFPETHVLLGGELLVVGSSAQPPAEMPAGVDYVRVNGFELGSVEFALGLYDHYGQVVDLLRATRPNSNLVHNDPRLPAHPDDFRKAAYCGPLHHSLVRNRESEDHNVGDDWHAFVIRTLGVDNPPTWTPDRDAGIDVRVNRRPGVSLSLILDAGDDWQGHVWSFALSVGHWYGQGPILGLGPDALANWIALSATPPFTGVLDSRGNARLDLDEALLPSGLPLDMLFVLVDPSTGALVTLTPVVSYDS